MSDDKLQSRSSSCYKSWPARRAILSKAATESTAHGLSRTVGDRHWIVRLIWLLAFLAVVGLLLFQLIEAVKRLVRQPVSTTVSPNADDFVFPDIHICPYPMVSASYSATMNASDLNYTNWQIDRIVGVLRQANITGEELSRLTAQIFVGTVPYSFLSRSMGMRMEQMFIGASVMPVAHNLELGVDIINLSHYKFLNCFSIRITSSVAQSLLNTVMGYLDLSLFADATYNTTLKLANGTIDIRGLGFINYDFLIGSGFRIYFTERGRYPDDYSTSVAISPGFHHYIRLSMRGTSLAKDKKECASNMPLEKIFDPVKQQPVDYTYSLGSCYAKSLSKMYRDLSLYCYIPGYSPIMYSDRTLPSCTNLTDLLNGYYSSATPLSQVLNMVGLIQKIYNGSVAEVMVDSVSKMQSDCQHGKPCNERIYEPEVTAVLFPLRQGIKTELTDIFRILTADRQSKYSVPGREWMVRLFDAAYGANSTAASEEEVVTVASENIVRVQIQAGELSSTTLDQDISYKLEDLAAGIGGLMGLFMGGSVLTLLELVELCVSLAFGRRLTATSGEPSHSGGNSNDPGSGGDDQQQQQQQQQQFELSAAVEDGRNMPAGKTAF